MPFRDKNKQKEYQRVWAIRQRENNTAYFIRNKELHKRWKERMKTSNIFQNSLGEWCRKCPTCEKVVTYEGSNSRTLALASVRNNSMQCRYCHRTIPYPNNNKLTVGDVSTIYIGTTLFEGMPDKHHVSFQVFHIKCPTCNTERIRKIPLISGWEARCFKCGSVVHTISEEVK